MPLLLERLSLLDHLQHLANDAVEEEVLSYLC